MEYLIVAGFVVFVLLGIFGVAYYYTGGISGRVRMSQVENYANKIVSSAESVFYAGEPSKLTLSVYLPSGVGSIDIIDNNLVFNVTTSSGVARIAYASDVPISGSLSNVEGLRSVSIVAQVDGVALSSN